METQGGQWRLSEAPYLFIAFFVCFCCDGKHFGLGQTWFTKAIPSIIEWLWAGHPMIPTSVIPTCKVGICRVIGGPHSDLSSRENLLWGVEMTDSSSCHTFQDHSRGYVEPFLAKDFEWLARIIVGHSCPLWDSSNRPSLLWAAVALLRVSPSCTLAVSSSYPDLPPPSLHRCQTCLRPLGLRPSSSTPALSSFYPL